MELLAHGEEVHSVEEVLAFNPHLDLLLALGLIVGGYVFGLRVLSKRWAPQGEPAVTRSQIVLFSLGIALWAIVGGYPIHDIAERSLFTFHMIEHLVLALVVPPLILAGTPWWLLRRLVLPFLGVLKVLTRPIVALLIFNAVLAAIHIPAVVEGMVTNEVFHFFAHFLLMATAFLMWWPIIGPIPDTPRLQPLPAMGYIFALSIIPTVPAAWLTFARDPVYPIYETLPRLWGVSVLTDQTVAGLIMKLGGGAILWSMIIYIFFTWFFDEQKYSPQVPVTNQPQ